jgi:hypothetical protein
MTTKIPYPCIASTLLEVAEEEEVDSGDLFGEIEVEIEEDFKAGVPISKVRRPAWNVTTVLS